MSTLDLSPLIVEELSVWAGLYSKKMASDNYTCQEMNRLDKEGLMFMKRIKENSLLDLKIIYYSDFRSKQLILTESVD